MDANTRSKVVIVLGIVILIVDILWLYGSVHYGGAGSGSMPYRNFTRNYTQMPHNLTRSGLVYRVGYPSYIDMAYGLIILIADLIWLYLDLSKPKAPAKTSAKSR